MFLSAAQGAYFDLQVPIVKPNISIQKNSAGTRWQTYICPLVRRTSSRSVYLIYNVVFYLPDTFPVEYSRDL
jgi:hypothetical protein